jgi:hypothetical protein
VYCPFNALKEDAVDRHRQHPEQVADALTLEHMSMALNPRGTLYKGNSLVQITRLAANCEALEMYQRKLSTGTWAKYRVRRIYRAKGQAARAVEKLELFRNSVEARDHLNEVAASLGTVIEELHGIPYLWRERRSEVEYPTREEFLTVAPALVEAKARGGLARFEQKWSRMQLQLF